MKTIHYNDFFFFFFWDTKRIRRMRQGRTLPIKKTKCESLQLYIFFVWLTSVFKVIIKKMFYTFIFILWVFIKF
jgi:hypothetical protein